MARGVLVDAGPLVAILNQRDRHHHDCVAALKRMRQSLFTTWMPVTEAMYLLDFSPAAQSALLEMIERGALNILSIETEDLADIRALMAKYADLAMDFADATLVQVARRERLSEIFTLDQRDFGIYRLQRGRSFVIYPG
ncbi:MAG: PIN domain-containing protein [Gammaproteobacteria bacterium]|nr:PIN domain-containing protein [Gammaproteobacteria bacterium]